MAQPVDTRSRIDQATLAAKEFSTVYYEAMDKRRQAMSKIYREDASLVWNGHSVSGQEQIVKFLDVLPVSQHLIEGMDTQPIVAGEGMNDAANATILVNFTGKVRFQEHSFKSFTQSVILTAQESRWKIVSNVFRFME